MADNAYFAGNPVKLDISRSRMTAKPRWTGQWNTGYLVPVFARQVLPGETMKMSVSSAIRMVTPVVPVMDDMDITMEAFYVPNRLLLSRQSMSPSTNDSNHSWEAFIGAQDSLLNMPTPDPDFVLPGCRIDPTDYVVGGLADCLGFPLATSGYNVNALKFLAYYRIWSDYFREPNTQVPVTYSIMNSINNVGIYRVSFVGADAGIPTGVSSYASQQYPLAGVSRYHGYFGSALPWPQRNSNQLTFPFGTSADVKTSLTPNISGSGYPLLWGNSNGDNPGLSDVIGLTNGGESIIANQYVTIDGNPVAVSQERTSKIHPTNLYADLSQATAVTVNQFRLTIQTQRWYEALARSGNKYPDLIAGMFDVRNDLGLSRPEYLGGFTAPIQMSQVAATATINGNVGNSGLGQVGAYSLSNPGGFLFSKSFTEHGIVMVVACCRTKESFGQGVQAEDRRFHRFDFYWPQFANLGEQPLLESTIRVTGSSSDDDVFGYQEAWAEERMIPDQVCGQFRPGGNMAHWTYVNNFTSNPTLKGYLDARNQVANVDRTLTTASTTAGFQFFGQFEFDITMVKPMPLYSIPGLVDHH